MCLCFISALTDIIKRVPSTPLRVRGGSTRSHSAHLFERGLTKIKPIFFALFFAPPPKDHSTFRQFCFFFARVLPVNSLRSYGLATFDRKPTLAHQPNVGQPNLVWIIVRLRLFVYRLCFRSNQPNVGRLSA